jgi:hypothetical protein
MLKLLVMAVVACSAVASAQEPPTGDGAWVLRVVSRGGITGIGRGNFTISSDAQLTCSRPGCAPTLSEARVRQIGEMIAAIDAAAWVSQPKSICSDCYETVLTVYRREGQNVRVYVAQWDDSQRVSSQIRNVSEAVTGLGTAAAR